MTKRPGKRLSGGPCCQEFLEVATVVNEKQLNLIEPETSWFHVFRTMVDSGDVATMGPYAVTV